MFQTSKMEYEDTTSNDLKISIILKANCIEDLVLFL